MWLGLSLLQASKTSSGLIVACFSIDFLYPKVIHSLLSAGDKQLFACSGTIVEFCNDVGYVVTSASLVRCPDKYLQVDKPKVGISTLYGIIVL